MAEVHPANTRLLSFSPTPTHTPTPLKKVLAEVDNNMARFLLSFSGSQREEEISNKHLQWICSVMNWTGASMGVWLVWWSARHRYGDNVAHVAKEVKKQNKHWEWCMTECVCEREEQAGTFHASLQLRSRGSADGQTSFRFVACSPLAVRSCTCIAVVHLHSLVFSQMIPTWKAKWPINILRCLRLSYPVFLTGSMSGQEHQQHSSQSSSHQQHH